MEQVYVWINRLDEEPETREVRFLYDVIIKRDGQDSVKYSCDMPLDIAKTSDENIVEVQKKVLADAVYRGFKITLDDVIVPTQTKSLDAASKDQLSQPVMGLAELPVQKAVWARSVDYVKSLWS